MTFESTQCISYEIPKCNIEDLLNELKPYQKNNLQKLLGNLSDLNIDKAEEVAKTWLSANGPQNNIPFGGVQDSKPFFDMVKKEFYNFLCNDNEYIEEKEELKKQGSVVNSYTIAVISGAISVKIGFAASLLAPVVVLLIFSVCKIGKNAFCKSFVEQ
jgi:hypothetical protein